MRIKTFFQFTAVCAVLTLFLVGCKSPEPEKTQEAADMEAKPVAEMPDMAAVKAEIQALETAWAEADNARDANAIAAFYADDAVTLSNNKPMISGKADIQKDIEASLAKRTKGYTTAYDVVDVYGDGNVVTEVGKITGKDASGKVTYSGKYMAVWERRDGKFVCIRDISNDDAKEK